MKPRSLLGFGLLVGFAAALAGVVFYYQPAQEGMLLSEFFPSPEKPSHIEYEIVDESLQPRLELSSPQERLPEEEVFSSVVSNVNAKAVVLPVSSGVIVQPSKNAFTIQVASFKDAIKAEKTLENLRAKYGSVYISSKDLGEKGVWYRICLGQFEARNEADELLADVKKTFKDSFVVSIR
jgi:cell division septation protein DedD